MILEYSYDSANTILELLKGSKLASLTVAKHGDVYAMEYTLIEDYSEAKQVFIRKNLAEALPQRLKVVELMNQFVENQILGLVNNFALSFDAVNKRKCQIQYSVSFAEKAKKVSEIGEQHNEPVVQMQKNLEQLENILMKLGAQDQLVNVYRREGSGRNKKHVQLTLQGAITEIRKSLEG